MRRKPKLKKRKQKKQTAAAVRKNVAIVIVSTSMQMLYRVLETYPIGSKNYVAVITALRALAVVFANPKTDHVPAAVIHAATHTGRRRAR